MTATTTGAAETSDDIEVVPEAPAPEEPAGSPNRMKAAIAGFSLRDASSVLIPPIVGIAVFLALWAFLAPRVDTALGELPGPVQVVEAGGGLWDEYQASRAEEAAFYEAQAARNAQFIADGNTAAVQNFQFSGSPTFLDQIWTSLRTVGLGFLIGTIIAIPLGLLSGLSVTFQRAINPLVQVFKPVSPLAWLPIVTMVISATVTSDDPILPRSFIVSALVVTLNS